MGVILKEHEGSRMCTYESFESLAGVAMSSAIDVEWITALSIFVLQLKSTIFLQVFLHA